jgi:hypothetical protein
MQAGTQLLRRTTLALASLGLAALILAPSAGAADGEGLLGRPTDFEITMWGFGVIALFMILPVVLSIIQHKLDTRKERAREQLERVRRP